MPAVVDEVAATEIGQSCEGGVAVDDEHAGVRRSGAMLGAIEGSRLLFAAREAPLREARGSRPWSEVCSWPSMAPGLRHRAASPSATARSNGAQDWKSTRH